MMKRLSPLLGCAALLLSAGAGVADDLPPGLVSASLRPGYVTDSGSRMVALELVLAPGWKTYWRSPGDSGMPPQFDWSATPGLARATPHWPRPEVIESGGSRTLGYHERLVLPLELEAARPGAPLAPDLRVDLGICREVCVPVHLELTAPAADPSPDPEITAALAQVPVSGEGRPVCRTSDIADGVQIAATLPPGAAAPRASAMELAGEGLWVSDPVLTEEAGEVVATADVVGPTGKPFALDPAGLRLTLITDQGAVEYQGCAGS